MKKIEIRKGGNVVITLMHNILSKDAGAWDVEGKRMHQRILPTKTNISNLQNLIPGFTLDSYNVSVTNGENIKDAVLRGQI